MDPYVMAVMLVGYLKAILEYGFLLLGCLAFLKYLRKH